MRTCGVRSWLTSRLPLAAAAAMSWRRLDGGSGDCDSESAALALRFRLPPPPPPLLFLDDVDVASGRFSDLLKQSSFMHRDRLESLHVVS